MPPSPEFRSRVFLRVERVDPAVCAAAARCAVADLHEAMGGAAARRATMSPAMRGLAAGRRIAGPAITAACAPADNLMMHRALRLAEAGDVLVVAAPLGGAQWGDMAERYAQAKRLAGVVVDGFVRDVDALATLGANVWCTRIGPSAVRKLGHGSVNAPIVCDGVTVMPGDLVVADGDGVIVVPKAVAATVVERALARTANEAAHIAEIAAGRHLWDIHRCDAGYAKLAVEEIDAPWRPDPPAG
jgi:4-hydroxy-4-methyl-2-oxoglutarate aldolase